MAVVERAVVEIAKLQEAASDIMAMSESPGQLAEANRDPILEKFAELKKSSDAMCTALREKLKNVTSWLASMQSAGSAGVSSPKAVKDKPKESR